MSGLRSESPVALLFGTRQNLGVDGAEEKEKEKEEREREGSLKKRQGPCAILTQQSASQSGGFREGKAARER